MAGGLTGPILAQPILDQYLHNTYFVVAHFHLIMAMAGVFGLFAATYYWFPLMCGRKMNEQLGKWHFWLTILGAYATFLPMHVAGLMGEPRHYAQVSGLPAASARLLDRAVPVQDWVTAAAIVLAASQLLFLVNVAWSWRRGQLAEENPWGATTLEWRADTGEKAGASKVGVIVYRRPCCYTVGANLDGAEASFLTQWAVDKKPE